MTSHRKILVVAYSLKGLINPAIRLPLILKQMVLVLLQKLSHLPRMQVNRLIVWFTPPPYRGQRGWRLPTVSNQLSCGASQPPSWIYTTTISMDTKV
ncbi:hypothetical protein M8C21_031622 [Ambrosia artemisiifolia]|uniref:Uncharacterized protein n=1 Tax=Ambrosia artemisiifolia TaxID=4212 RepID=A0AAD5GDQ5_AMBAR|nr:hypothetical protein M8C21_031622 [Ambrosia artemisiifolia]